MKTYTLPVEIVKEEDGRWSAVIPLLPGCATWGYTKEEAIESLQEATKAYIEVLLEQKGSLPAEIEKRATKVPESSIAVTV